jgi:outer membrane protein assembly factor BamB
MKRLVSRRCFWGIALISVLPLSLPLRAEEPAGAWPQFLGPNRNAISQETGLTLDWKAKPPKVLWKVPLGPSFSSLAIQGERVVTMAQRDDRDFVVCLNADTGKEQWAYDAAPAYLDRQKQGAGPRSTPTIDGERVYALLPQGELVCVTLREGKKVWSINVFDVTGAKPRGDQFYWGASASPLIEGDLVIVPPGGDKDTSVVAFNKDTGKKVWGVGADPAGYASPIVVTACKRRMVVFPTGKSILGIDPAKGELLWRYPFGNQFDATCATPVWANDLLFVSAAYGVGCAALEIVADGDKLTVKEKWRNKSLRNLMATSIILDGHIYGCDGDLGAIILRCLDLKTGEMKWEQRQQKGRLSFLAAEGHLFCLGERGELQLIEANPAKYVRKGELADVLEYKAWAMPALARKRLYLRDEKNVVCLDLSKE